MGDALDGLPNTVIPDDSIHCTEDTVYSTSDPYSAYSLTFRGNPGYLKELFVDTYLDGHVPTVYDVLDSTGAVTYDHTVNVFNKGMTGEFVDYFATQCRHVYVKVNTNTGTIANLADADYAGATAELNSGYVLDFTSSMNTGGDEMAVKLLKQCLGDSDGIDDYYMMSSYPHAIKLVNVDPSDDYDGGMYFLTWWTPKTDIAGTANEGQFIVVNIPTQETLDSTFAVYVTDGVVERVIYDYHNMGDDDTLASEESGDQGMGEINPDGASVDPRITAYFEQYSNILYTSYDTACETAYSQVEPCLDKGDMLFIIDSRYLTNGYNPEGAGVMDMTHNDGTSAATITAATYETGNIC